MAIARNLIESPINWPEIDRSASFVVYCIRHIDSGAEYIGSTSRPLRQRIKEHRKDVRDGSQHPLHESIRQFGWNAFAIEILTYSTIDNLRSCEAGYINNSASLFNMAKGTQSPSAGWSHSESVKKTLSADRLGDKNPAARVVMVDGIMYATLKECCEKLGISFPTLRNRLLSEAYSNYEYAEK